MQYTIRVAEMNCGHCKSKVESAARSVETVTDAEVNLDAGTLSFDASDKGAVSQVMDAVRAIGYEPAQST